LSGIFNYNINIMPRTKSDHIRFDWAIKRLLRQKANFEILEGFISEVIGVDIKIVEILESQSNQPQIDIKYNQVDILSKSSNGELILIEVQNDREYDYFHRMAFGQARLISEHIDLKAFYKDLKKVYSISVVYFELGQGDDYFYEGKTTFTGKHTGNLLNLSDKQKELFNIAKVCDIFPEFYLIKVNNFDNVAKSTLDEWIYFLKNNKIEDNFKAKGIQKAKKVLQMHKLNGTEKADYDAYIKSNRIEMGVLQSIKIDALYEMREAVEVYKSEAQKLKIQKEKERQLKEVAEQKAVEERRLKEKERQLKEKERRLKEAAEQKAVEERRLKEEKEQKIVNMILKRHNKGMSISEITEDLELEESEVKRIIDNFNIL